MGKKGNRLTGHVKTVHRDLGHTLFIAFRNDRTAESQVTLVRRAIDSGRNMWLVTGCSIAALDIYAENPEWVAYSGEGVRGKDMLKLLDEANCMVQAAALVSVYEAMERYLKAVAVEYLYVKRGTVPILNKYEKRLTKRFGKKAERENTKPWFRQMVSVLAWQNCQPLLKLLFKHVEGLRDRVNSFYTGDLEATHQTVEFIRHLTTHINGRYDEEQAKKLPKQALKQLTGCVKKSFLHAGERWILPAHKTVSWFISRETEFAQVIYDSLTKELGMKLDYTPGHDPAEIKSK